MNTLISWDVVDFDRFNTEIAKELGVSIATVRRRKKERGIKSLVYRPKPIKIIDWNNVKLGSEPDEAIAIRLGSYRKAVAIERNKRNIPPFIGYILNQEGIPCRSLPEAMYDAYLHWKGIAHEHEVKVGKYRADFKIDNEYHEVAGLMGYKNLSDIEHTRFDYGKKFKRKLEELAKSGHIVITLTVRDIERLYKDCPLQLNFKVDHNCIVCKAVCNDYLMKGMCNKCYMKQWHLDNAQNEHICFVCNKLFQSSNENSKYCSRKCYHKSHSEHWPPLEQIEKMLSTQTYKEVAQSIEVTVSALAQHISRGRKNHTSKHLIRSDIFE